MLFADFLTDIKCYVDASHQTHDNCNGHTGSLLTFSSSTKQKVPSKSSTETELIDLHDISGNILWTQHFLEAQGYKITSNIIYQDYMSTLSLAKNGYVSSSKQTKHIKAKYLYVHHFHNTGDLTLQYCPTDQMWADILTKPLQGSKFRLFQAFLMNCPKNYTEEPPFIPRPTLQLISTNLLTKPQISKIMPSLRECVWAKPMSVKIHSQDHKLIPVPYNSTEKKSISWCDTLFPRHSLPAFHSFSWEEKLVAPLIATPN
jgi:hypothetical protein